MEMNRSVSAIKQVEAYLRARIHDREYLPGDRLPSELALTREFGASRATIRTVLTKLANEGLIVRRQGDGTYVSQHVGEVNTLGGVLDYCRLITESGYEPTIQSISMVQRGATPQEAANLNLEPDEPVVVLVRLFLADERPFILATNLIPQVLFTNEHDFYDGRLPLHEFLQKYCRQTIAYAIYEISPVVAADEKTTQLLNCQTGQQLLQFATTFYNRDDAPIVWGYSIYDDSVVKLRFMQSWV